MVGTEATAWPDCVLLAQGIASTLCLHDSASLEAAALRLLHVQVQSGVGRTGKWWAHEHFKGVVPDIMLFAKGIASGFPFAGIAAKPEMYHGLPTGSLVCISYMLCCTH